MLVFQAEKGNSGEGEQENGYGMSSKLGEQFNDTGRRRKNISGTSHSTSRSEVEVR